MDCRVRVRVWGLKFRDQGLGLRVSSLWFRDLVSGFSVLGRGIKYRV